MADEPLELVSNKILLERLFPDEADRPNLRWLDVQRKKGLIPFIRLGRLIYYNVPAVKRAIADRQMFQTRRRAA
jgi:hypothetical protein